MKKDLIRHEIEIQRKIFLLQSNECPTSNVHLDIQSFNGVPLCPMFPCSLRPVVFPDMKINQNLKIIRNESQ